MDGVLSTFADQGCAKFWGTAFQGYLRARCVLVNDGFVFVFYYGGYAVMIVSFVQLVQGQKGGSGCFPALFLPPLIF